MAFMAGGFVCVLSKTRAMAAGRLKGSSLFLAALHLRVTLTAKNVMRGQCNHRNW